MDFAKTKIPYLSLEKIQAVADKFREKYARGSVPIDVEKILSINLRMDIIPIKGLAGACDIDALVTSSWDTVYADYERYLDDRYQNRLRFSLAHELGHYVLHKNIYADFGVRSVEDIYKLLEDLPQMQYDRLELQANAFAGQLLVSTAELNYIKEEVIRRLKESEQWKEISEVDARMLDSYLAIPVSQYFGVSVDVIERRLQDEHN